MKAWLGMPSTISNSSACDWECRALISSSVRVSASASQKYSMLNVLWSSPTAVITRRDTSAM